MPCASPAHGGRLPLLRFTQDVRDAVKYRNWYSAIALALTLPDICGKIAYPQMKGSGKRYERWFNEWLGEQNRFTTNDGQEVVMLTGGDCYALRCAYLHRGGDDISDQKAREILSRFFFTTMNAHRVRGNREVMVLNTRIFCLEVCLAVDAWYGSVMEDARAKAEIEQLLTIRTEPFAPGGGIGMMYVATTPACESLGVDAPWENWRNETCVPAVSH